MSICKDDVIALFDRTPGSPPARSEIAYRLLREANVSDDLVKEVISEYHAGFRNRTALADVTNRLSVARDAHLYSSLVNLYHLAWGLLPGDDDLEGILAEFYYDWATALGVPEDRITEIICEAAHF